MITFLIIQYKTKNTIHVTSKWQSVYVALTANALWFLASSHNPTNSMTFTLASLHILWQ